MAQNEHLFLSDCNTLLSINSIYLDECVSLPIFYYSLFISIFFFLKWSYFIRAVKQFFIVFGFLENHFIFVRMAKMNWNQSQCEHNTHATEI